MASNAPTILARQTGGRFMTFHPDANIYEAVITGGTTGTTAEAVFTFVDADVNTGTDAVAETAHGYASGDGPVRLSTTGTLPAGLSTTTTYYIIRVDADNIKFATTLALALAGTAVNITAAAGGGTHTVNAYVGFGSFIFQDADVNTGTDAITATAHGLGTGDGPCRLTSGVTLPAGLSLATDYWIIKVDANTVKLASSIVNAYANTAVDITAAASTGNHILSYPATILSFRAASTGLTVVQFVKMYAQQPTGFGFGRHMIYELYPARAFTASDTTGTAATLTGNNQKSRTADATSGLVDLRICGTTPIAAGTRTLDTQYITMTGGAFSTNANSSIIVGNGIPSAGDPQLVFEPNEGFVIQLSNQTPYFGVGTVIYSFDVCWMEIPEW